MTIASSVTKDAITYSVTSIGDRAFYYCSGLTSVTIPNSVTAIGNEAFYKCSGLTSITVENDDPGKQGTGLCLLIAKSCELFADSID